MPTNKRRPQAKNYRTDDGLHAAMAEWADEVSHSGVLKVTAEFGDGSTFTDTVQRAPREVSYRTRDGELYSVVFDTHRFVDEVYSGGIHLTRREMEKRIRAWLEIKATEKSHITFEVTEDE